MVDTAAASKPSISVPSPAIKKILVVEDQPEIRKLIRMILNLDHYAIYEAADAYAGLNMVTSIKPDLLLLDIMLPIPAEISSATLASGLDLCRLLKALPEYATLPIILLTAKGQLVDRAAGLAAGADEYLIKPFSPLHLSEIVQFHLAKSNLA